MIETPKINRKILTRGLPKTGQTSVYAAGDDGTHQAGWWRRRSNMNNRSRFILKLIGEDYIIIDRATGLWWSFDDGNSINNNGNVLTWSSGIQYPTGRSYAGKSDWRIPNIQEMISIINYGITLDIARYDVFFFSQTSFWTSTTYFPFSEKAWGVSLVNGSIDGIIKTGGMHIFCCRGGI